MKWGCSTVSLLRFVRMLKIKIICLYVVISVFVCVNSLLNLPEGAPCSTSGHNGICVNLFKCHFTAIGYLYNRAGYNTPPLPDTCSYREDEEPIVCCAECSLDPGETMRYYDVMPGGYFYKNTGSVAWKKCLEYFRSLPYSCRGSTSNFLHKYGSEPDKCEQWSFGSHPAGPGGIPARRWQFPHKALLGYGDDQNSAQWLCGGSVISEHYILTAAHCLGTPNLGKVKFAALGVLKRSDLEEYWKVYRIVEAIPYPEYKSPVRYHDIALLRTETEINFGRGVLPACLETGDRGPNTEDIGEAPGWGRLGHRQDLADTLQVLTLHKYEDHECAATFPPHRHLKEGYNRTTQMCYGRKDALVDTCEGDSGGPLHDDLEECMYFIFGITSFGKECGVPGTPGMYTRVRFYVPWIESIVWPDEPEIKRSTTL